MSEGEEFTFGVWTWDVDQAQQAARLVKAQPLPISNLGALISMGLIYVDAEHADTVDLDKPILVAPLPETATHLPIDGWHRIAKALSQGVTELPAKVLTAEQAPARRRRTR